MYKQIVKFKAGNKREAMYFFENIILVTTYKNNEMFDKSEENFRPLMKQLRPNGPLLLNTKKVKDLFTLVESYTTSVRHQARK